MHILFADDSRAVALPIVEFLKRQGHEVTYVTNGREAVEAFQAQRFDLALLDVVMPNMDGIAATRHIKALMGGRWVPVMLMTTLSAKEEIVAGLNAGADEYLIKPLSVEVLDARVQAMQRIATIQDSLTGILDNVYEGIITIDTRGIISSYNQAAERIFGYSAAEVIGRNVNMLMPEPYAQAHDSYLHRYQREGTPHVIGIGRKVAGQRKNGDVFPMKLAVTEVQRTIGNLYIGLVSDISAEEAARQRIEFLALHDPLTELPNRAHFNQALEQALHSSQDSSHALLYIDLDGFKPINDTLGHEAGDEALKVVAARLRQHLAQGDFVARLGGDEFVVIAHHTPTPTAAQEVAQRLIHVLGEPMSLKGQPCQMGASIGIALMPQHGQIANDVLTAADNAMYHAKRSGKNRSALAPMP